ncbi:GNAT family N-acetyltransferase [Antrihabitans cavernicola]|uniref:GNAT family N-acetyltransferase n=1 Tax=Antrihabitans cavernicola TaxID=2495913 RepID=A0A5A7SGD6_9NOCA|nr:GNAT family N-acetyltransferase [Spelaeibacter cavernicola]KAA0024886.1 GNAT family N-acetyltransferase [Spelaeibacter cavernicola]
MYSQQFTFETDEPPAAITRVADTQWLATVDDRTVGSGDVTRRPDGRLFVSIDTWHAGVFDQLVTVLRTELPKPIYTVVDESETDLTTAWLRTGFTPHRREWEYSVPTDPTITGLDATAPPPGVTILPAGTAAEGPLRAVDRAIRDEVEASIGWQHMPAEILHGPSGDTVVDPSKYAVAVRSDRYVGMVRVVRATRRPRIGLIAVRADQQRRGVARALLAHALAALHSDGRGPAYCEVDESNSAAAALFDGVGAQRVSCNLELVLR